VDPLSKPEWRAGVSGALGSQATRYTPILTAATTDPTNWTSAGEWCRIGPLVWCRFTFLAGASVTAGSGNYRIILPVPATPPPLGVSSGLGTLTCWDSSGNARANVAAILPWPQGDYIEGRYPATWPTGTSTALGPGTPFTWAQGDQILGTLIYQAAA
jgi:hypothetical protein